MTIASVRCFTFRVNTWFITNWKASVRFIYIFYSITIIAPTDIRFRAFSINTFFCTSRYTMVRLCYVVFITIIASACVWSSAITINATVLASWHTFIVVVLHETLITLTSVRGNTLAILTPTRTCGNALIGVNNIPYKTILTNAGIWR
jgi:hypothetical protein